MFPNCASQTLFQIAVVLILLPVTLWQLSITIITYIQQPTSTFVSVGDLGNWFVPTLTVCHQTPFKSFDYLRLRLHYNISKDLFHIILFGTGFITQKLDWSPDQLELKSNISIYEEEYGKLMKMLAINATDPLSILHKMIKNFSAPLSFRSCSMNGTLLEQEDCEKFFIPSLDIERGICKTLTADARKLIQPHLMFSFHWIQKKDDHRTVTLTEVPPAMNPTVSGIVPLYPHENAFVTLEAKRVKSKKNCLSSDSWTPQYLPINLINDHVYSIDNCIADLKVKTMIERAKCAPILYRNPDKRKRCSIFDFAKFCYSRINESRFEILSSELQQFCKFPCDYTGYTYSLIGYSPSTPSFLTGITLSFHSPGVFTIEEQSKLDILDWFGQIGNILGLWLGFGMLDIAWVLHFAYRKAKQKYSRQESLSLNGRLMIDYLIHVRSLLCPNKLSICLKQNQLCKFTSKRIITLVGFMVLVVIAAWQGLITIQEYLKSPVRTLVRVEEADKLLFPTVTVCRHLPFYRFNYETIKSKYDVSDQLLTIILLGAGFIPPSHGACLIHIIQSNYEQVSNWTVLEEQLQLLLKRLNKTESALLDEWLNNWAMDIDVSYCEFNGSQVETNYCRQLFTRSLHMQHGICSTFYARQLIQPQKKVVMEWNELDMSENVLDPMCTASFHMYITDTTVALQSYFLGELNLLVFGEPNYYVTRVQVTNRLTNCREPHSWTSRYLPDLIRSEKNSYSVENCVGDMIIKRIFTEAMKCVPILYKNPDNLPRCTVFEVANFSFLLSTKDMDSFSLYLPSVDEIADECPYACGDSSVYSTTRVKIDNATEKKVARLELIFESDAVLRSSELLKYSDFTAWFSQIGGILNLWLNFSFLSLALIAQKIYEKLIQRLPSEDEAAASPTILERLVSVMEDIFNRKRRLVVKIQYTIRHVLVTRILLTAGWLVLAGISVWQITKIVLDWLQNPTESVVNLVSTYSSEIHYPVLAFCPSIPFFSFNFSAMEQKYRIPLDLYVLIILGAGFLPFENLCYQEILSRALPPESTNWTWLRNEMAEFEERFDLLVFADDLFNELAMQPKVLFEIDSITSLTQVNSSSWHIQRGLCTVFDGRTKVPAHEQLSLLGRLHIPIGTCSEIMHIEGSDVYNMLKSLYGSLAYDRLQLGSYTFIDAQKIKSIKNCQRRLSGWTSKYSRSTLEYSLENCVTDLIIEKMFAKEMGCIPILYNNPDFKRRCSLFEVANRSYLLSQNKTVSSGFWYLPNSDEIAENCLQPCEKTLYTFYSDDSRYTRDDWLAFRFIFGSSDILMATEQEKLKPIEWLAALGGILNLWIGFSFLSLLMGVYVIFDDCQKVKQYRCRVASSEEHISSWLTVLRYLAARTQNESRSGQDIVIPIGIPNGKDASSSDKNPKI